MAIAFTRGAVAGTAWLIVAGLALLNADTAHAAVDVHGVLRPDLLFEQNIGQDVADASFRVHLPGIDARVQQDGSLLLLRRAHAATGVRLIPGGARAGVKLKGLEPSPFRTNYFRGGEPPEKFIDVPHFGRVAVHDIYPGIDLEYHTAGQNLEFDYIVSAGADISKIRITIQGADSVYLSKSGDLVIERDGVILLQRQPTAYQVREGQRIGVNCAYGMSASNEISLALGPFDHGLPLVIDPVIEYASYLGGSGNDNATAIAIGSDGYLYVTGGTSSSNFPVLGAYDSSLGGTTDVFVAKINPATGKKVYATYIGGTGWDNANAIAVDSSGNVYVTGHAESRYPTTTGAYETATITQAGFVTKLLAAGNALGYSTYVYGTTPHAIAVDSQGRAVVTGAAGTSFVTSIGAYRTAYIGSTISDQTMGGDAFALMLNAAGSGTVFATFVGGTGTDEGRGIAVDATGRIVVGGWTTSTDMPMSGPTQSTFAGVADGFIAALAPDGKSLAYSTYFGGAGNDKITGLALDPYGNIVVSGDTGSDDLPTANALLTRSSLALRGSTQKTFVAKFAASPLSLLFSTYGGSADNCCESSYGIATDAAGDIYLFGYMNAGNLTRLQTVHPFLSASYVSAKLGTTNSDAFFAAGYARDGQALRFQTLLGACGEAMQCSWGGIAARGSTQVAIAGDTHVTWMPIAAYNTQPKASVPSPTTSDDEAFVMTLGLEPPAMAVSAANPNPVAATSVTLVATSYSAGTTGIVTFSDGSTALGTASMVQGVAKFNATFAAGVHRITATLGSIQTPLLLLPVVLAGVQ